MRPANTCKNCSSPGVTNYCSDCGQKVYTERFSLKHFFHELLTVFNLERGFLHTAIMLFRQPGETVNDYLNGKTQPYINPLKYMLVIGGVYAFLILGLGIFDSGLESFSNTYVDGTAQHSSEKVARLQNQLLYYFKQIINFIPLLMIPFISIGTRWFYKSKALLYGEHLIVNSYIFVHSFLILTLLFPAVLVFPFLKGYFPYISLGVIIGYFTYALHRTFREPVVRSLFGAFLSLCIGYLFFLTLILLTVIIAVIIITMSAA